MNLLSSGGVDFFCNFLLLNSLNLFLFSMLIYLRILRNSSCSMGPPGGNLVDDLPPALHQVRLDERCDLSPAWIIEKELHRGCCRSESKTLGGAGSPRLAIRPISAPRQFKIEFLSPQSSNRNFHWPPGAENLGGENVRERFF